MFSGTDPVAVRIAAHGLTDVLSGEGEEEYSRSQRSPGTQEWCENSRGPNKSPIPKELEKKERKVKYWSLGPCFATQPLLRCSHFF